MRWYRRGVVLLTIVGLVVGGLTFAVAAAIPPGTIGQGADHQGAANASADEIGAGAQLAGVVAVQDESIRGDVDRGAFAAELEGATSTAERAAVVDRELAALDRRIAAIDRRHRSLESARENGSIGAGVYTAKSATIGGAARDVDRHLTAVATAAADLPADVRAERRLDERIDALTERTDELRERTREAVEAVDGAGRPVRTTPLSEADVAAAMAQLGDADDRLVEELRSERIELHVRAANGSTKRFGVEAAGGASQRVEPGPMDDPTVRVHTDYRVIRALQLGENPARVVREGLEADRIAIEGVGLRNSFKYGVVSIAESLGLG